MYYVLGVGVFTRFCVRCYFSTMKIIVISLLLLPTTIGGARLGGKCKPCPPCKQCAAAAELGGDRPMPRFLYINEVFTPSECEQIIHTAMRLELREAGTGSAQDTDTKTVSRNRDVRRAQYAGLMKPNFAPVYQRIVPLANRLNDANWRFHIARSIDSPAVELVQFSLYNSSDQGFYDWHLDLGLQGQTGRRRISVTVQLSKSEAYEGGTLDIMAGRDPTHMPREQGGAVIFPSYMLHRVAPVTRGVRFSLVAWFEELPS